MFDLQIMTMKKPAPSAYRCPSCMAEYKMVLVESPQAPARDMRCVRCGFPFPSTEDRMFVRYILAERPDGSKLS
jgi:DNA-directed RNA polymerase subunit RPC12/RpoP